jgi:protein O-GlcNAc transferase
MTAQHPDSPHLPELQAALTHINAGRKHEAREILERILERDGNDHNALQLLGALLIDSKQRGLGTEYLERSLAIKPGMPAVLNNLGCALFDDGHFEKAAEYFQQVVAIWTDRPSAYFHLGNAFYLGGRLPEARTAYEQTLKLKPDHQAALGMLVTTTQSMCAWNHESHMISVAADTQFTGPPFQLLQLTDDPALQFNAARGYATTFQRGDRTQLQTGDGKKIRVAYVSAGFQKHPVGQTAVELFERHDRQQFEIHAVSLGRDDGTPLRKRLTSAFVAFADFSGGADEDVAAYMRTHKIDIAVDLDGYTYGNRAQLFSQGLAPIQVNYLGYPGTLGSDVYDYILVDPFVAPTAHQPFFAEKLVHLPIVHLPSDRERKIAERLPSPQACGLPEDGFIFCAFNNPVKIRPDVFGVWMRLLQKTPDSVLWLRGANDFAQENLRRATVLHGIDPSRIVFAAHVADHADYLALYRLADLFLDTFPYSAFTTASDALWAGLPVLTLSGRTFASRGAGCMLTALGLPELVTHSLAEYEQRAVQLSSDPAARRVVRDKLARNRDSTEAFNTDNLARHIEAAFATMVDIHRRGEPPRAFAVG